MSFSLFVWETIHNAPSNLMGLSVVSPVKKFSGQNKEIITYHHLTLFTCEFILMIILIQLFIYDTTMGVI